MLKPICALLLDFYFKLLTSLNLLSGIFCQITLLQIMTFKFHSETWEDIPNKSTRVSIIVIISYKS